MPIKILYLMLVVATYTLLNGCASFPQNEMAQVQQMPTVAKYKNKPSVYIDFKFFRGSPDSNAVEITTAKDKLIPTIEQVVADSKLFRHATFDEFEKEKTGYTLKLHVYNHGDTGAAAASGFITGLTLGIIPGAATDKFTLRAELSDKSGRELKRISNDDSVTTWIGIWFIPLMGNTPDDAVTSTLTNQVRSALKQLVESGKLKYSRHDDSSIFHTRFFETTHSIYVSDSRVIFSTKG